MEGARTAAFAGAVAGLVALGVFLVVHALWIRPIWGIAPTGAAIAALGGAIAGWAYEEHRPRLPTSAIPRILAVTLAGATVLAPAEVIALVRGPVPVAVLATMTIADAWLPLLAFFLAAPALGALLGWRLVGSRRASAITALAAFLFAVASGTTRHSSGMAGSRSRCGASC